MTTLGPTDMNHLETGVLNATNTADAAIPKPASPSSNDGLFWNGSAWVNAKLVNANVDPAAAIAYSKLQLAGSIVNNDIAVGAGIVTSKLNIASGDIAISKIADPGSGLVIGSTGSGAVAVKPPGTELDYKEATADVSITATTFATATTLLTGNATTFDGTAVWIEIYSPHVTSPASADPVFLNVWDGSTDLGIMAKLSTSVGGVDEEPVYARRKYTPSAGSHTFSIRGTMNSGTGTFGAGAGGTGGTFMPAFLRITKA